MALDPQGPFQQQQRPRNAAGPILLLLVALAVLFLFHDPDEVSHALRHPLEGDSLLLVGAALLAIFSLLALLASSLRPSSATKVDQTLTPPETLRHASHAQPSTPVTPSRPVQGHTSHPDHLPEPPKWRPPSTGVPKPSGKGRGGIVALAVVVALVSGVGKVVHALTDSAKVDVPTFTTSVPDFSTGPDCPKPAAGDDMLDDSTTDCAPIEFDDVISSDRDLTVQGHPYRLVTREELGDDCSSIALSAPVDEVLNPCVQAFRSRYVTPDGLAVGSQAMLVFTDADDAKAAERVLSRGADVRVEPLADPDASGTPETARIETLEGVIQVCVRTGRYVHCAVTAPTKGRDDEASRNAAGTMLGDLLFVTTDVLVARRFG